MALFFSYPKAHFRFADALIQIGNGIHNPCSIKVIVCPLKKFKALLFKYTLYFFIVYRMLLLVPIVR